MKQTAVEWIIEQLQAPCRGIPSHIIEQAKAMEKNQIIHAWENGGLPDLLKEYKNSRTYYNETYNK